MLKRVYVIFFFFRERWLTLDNISKLIIDLQKYSYAITILKRLLATQFYIIFSSSGNKYPVLSKIHLA